MNQTQFSSRRNILLNDMNAKTITIYVNGDQYFKGKKIEYDPLIHTSLRPLLESIQRELPSHIRFPHGIRQIFTPRGFHRIRRVRDICNGSIYICAGKEPFKPMNYEFSKDSQHFMSRSTDRKSKSNRPEVVLRRQEAFSLPRVNGFVRETGHVEKASEQKDKNRHLLKKPVPSQPSSDEINVTVIRKGASTHNSKFVSVKVTMKRTNMQTLGQVMSDISEAFGPLWRHNRLRSLFHLNGREVRSLNELLRSNNEVFVGMGTYWMNDKKGGVFHQVNRMAPLTGPELREALREHESQVPRDDEQLVRQWEKRMGLQTTTSTDENAPLAPKSVTRPSNPASSKPPVATVAPPPTTTEPRKSLDDYHDSGFDETNSVATSRDGEERQSRPRHLKQDHIRSEKRTQVSFDVNTGVKPAVSQRGRSLDQHNYWLNLADKRVHILDRAQVASRVLKEARENVILQQARESCTNRKALSKLPPKILEESPQKQKTPERLPSHISEGNEPEVKASPLPEVKPGPVACTLVTGPTANNDVTESKRLRTSSPVPDGEKENVEKVSEEPVPSAVKSPERPAKPHTPEQSTSQPAVRERVIFTMSSLGKVVPDSKPIEELYELGKVLGDGNFAVVKHATRKSDSREFAIKIIDKWKLRGKKLMLESEIRTMRRCNHKNIIRLRDFYDTPNEVWLVLELIKGGDLFDAITRSKRFTEEVASSMVQDMASALFYLHARSIMHRDLKPENFLVLRHRDGQLTLKLGDFGLAMEYVKPEYTVCGTPTYIAPEILLEIGYGMPVDVWALGVIMYILLCGFAPFKGAKKRQSDLFRKIRSGSFEFVRPYWDHVSTGAVNLLLRILVVDQSRRCKAIDVLADPWVYGQGKSPTPADPEYAVFETSRQTYREELESQLRKIRASESRFN